jgi:hypothetical protein
MHTQHSEFSAARRQRGLRLMAGQAVSVGPWPGEIAVVDGRVWLTRSGDAADHVLEAGQRWRTTAAQHVVIESEGQDATVRWQPLPQPFARRVFAGVGGSAALRLLAGAAGTLVVGLDRLRAGLDNLARSAAASANRAQGCMASGESMACGGTVQ